VGTVVNEEDAMPPVPASQRLILAGRVVTMDVHDTVHDRGLVCVEDGVVRAVLPQGETMPAEFAGVLPVATGGTIYPGLIELHNHLPYNVLGLWQVPRLFTNRDQWRDDTVPDYRRLVSGPMTVLGKSDAVAAIVRYV
jgi:5-methylthioadenosine/S-adenosylhomocysteine deaminase